MKKLIISICTVFCLLATPLSSIEWGGLLFNDTGVSTPDFKDITVNQADGVSLWLKSPLGADSGFYFSSEVLYKFNIEIPIGDDPVFTQVIDLPLLKVYGDLVTDSGVLSLSAGRFYYVDGTSAVLSQIIDGVSVSYALPTVKAGGFVGYTGLLNALNVPMAAVPEKDNNIYNLAYPYLPIGVFVELPALGGNQSLEFDVYHLLDFGSAKTNMTYANVILSGPITNIVYYNAATSLGLMNFKDVMNYSSLSFLVFPSEALSLNAGVTFATAAEQGSLTAYTSPSPVSIASAGKITPKAAVTFTTKNMCIDFGGNFVLAYNDKKYEPSNTDWNAGIIYNIFSDLQVGFTVNTSFDVSGAKAHNYNAKLNISLAF